MVRKMTNETDEKLVFSDYDEFEEALEELHSEKVFRLTDSQYEIYLTKIKIKERFFLSLIGAKKREHHLDLYEVTDEEPNLITSHRNSRGNINSEDDAVEATIVSIGFEILEKFGGGI
jgi:hypothetical protein